MLEITLDQAHCNNDDWNDIELQSMPALECLTINTEGNLDSLLTNEHKFIANGNINTFKISHQGSLDV